MKVLGTIEKFFMTLTIREYILLTIIVILTILFLRGYFHKDDNVITVLPVLKPTTQKTDKKGTQYTEIKGTLYTKDQMKIITDSIQRVLGKGKVVQVTRTVTKVDTVIKQDTMFVDASGYLYIADSQKDFQLSYTGNWKDKQGHFHMKLTPDTATGVTTIKKHLLRANELLLNEYHTNSLFIPSEGYVYTAKVPKVIGAIGPTIGGAYCTDGKLHGFAGIGITLNIIGIKNNR